MRHDDPHIRNRVSDPTYSEKLEVAAKERAYKQELEREQGRVPPVEWGLLTDALAALKMMRGEDFQNSVIVRLEQYLYPAEPIDERWSDFLARKKAEMVPVDLIGQLEARLDALELRYMNRAREF